MSFDRIFWPCACPLLQGSVRADRTAAASLSNADANIAIAGAAQAFVVMIRRLTQPWHCDPESPSYPRPTRARSATALAVSSCSTQVTKATATASRAEVA